jgi:hypothetical protein
MKKLSLRLLTLFLFVAGIGLWAADVWVSKPYTEWTEKDLAKIMTDSPWAKKVSVSMSDFGPAGRGGAPGRGGPGGPGGGPDPGTGLAEDAGAGGGRGGGGGGGRGLQGGGGGGDFGGGAAGTPEVDLTVRWQTAPTVMEALAKAKYGAEAGTSADAKKMLEPDDKYYVIWVSGLPGSARPRDEEAKKELLSHTTLAAKDKDAIVAEDVVFPAPQQGGFGPRPTDAHFLFPRKTAFTPADKEVEFATRFGKAKVQAKFALKNMVVNGKLGL